MHLSKTHYLKAKEKIWSGACFTFQQHSDMCNNIFFRLNTTKLLHPLDGKQKLSEVYLESKENSPIVRSSCRYEGKTSKFFEENSPLLQRH